MRRNRFVVLLLGLALLWALADRESGLRRWWSLSRDLAAAESRIQQLQAEVERLEGDAAALRDDRFAQERAIRQDLGLAQPGEVIVSFDSPAEGPAQRP